MIEAPMGEVSLFGFIRGEAGVDRLVEAFYAQMETIPKLGRSGRCTRAILGR